jgi:hypothetical protein
MTDRSGKTFDGNGENQGVVGGFINSGEHGTAPDVGRASPAARQAGDRAFEARPTQGASRGRPIVKPDKATAFVGQSINQQGNTLAFRRREPGRIWRKARGAADRPAGMSNARYSTGVNPEDPVNDSPYWPRP